jgi:hypothetical protein
LYQEACPSVQPPWAIFVGRPKYFFF